jgi:antitoxin component of RelBE/YafQ-DinJ toxin-antitoxin module
MTYAKYLDKDGRFDSITVQQALAAGNDPIKQAAIRSHVAGLQASEFRLDRNSKLLDNEMKTSKVNSDRFEDYAHRGANEIVSSAMGNFMFTAGGMTGKLNDAMKLIDNMQKNGSVDPEALKAIGLNLGKLRDNMSMGLDNFFRAPISKDNPQSPASLIKDNAKVEAIKKQYLSTIDTLITQVGQDNTHLATANAAVIKNMKENAVLRVMGLETIQKMAGIEGALGPSAAKVLDLMHTHTNWKDLNELSMNLTTLRMQRTVTGLNEDGLDSIATDYTKASEASTVVFNAKEPPSDYLKANIEFVKQLATNPDLPIDMRIKAASEIANDKTINFIQRFDTNKQFDVWATIYAPEVTKGIKLTMPQDTWNKYRTLGEETFVRLFNTYIDTVNQGVQDNRGINPRWNENTQQIDYDERRIPRGVALADPARVSINRLNAGLRTYANILREDGEVITSQRLKAIGLELDLKLKNPNAEDLLKTLSTIPEAGTPKLFQKSTKEDLSKAPRDELNSFLSKHSLPEDTPMYQGKELIKNPNDVIKDAKLVPNGDYFVKRDNQWFKIVLPSR